MRLSTIGFTKKTASEFFEALRSANVRRVVDVRLNNVSQLAGFAKKQDLPYFLDRIAGIDYIHLPLLAPTQHLLDLYKKGGGTWEAYATDFLGLMTSRKVETFPALELLDGDCLLCSEASPHHCHRRLVAEYMKSHRGNIEIQHLQ